MNYWHLRVSCLFVVTFAAADAPAGEIGIINPAEARKLIEDPDPAKRPVVLDTRGGYKDYFRGHPSSSCRFPDQFRHGSGRATAGGGSPRPCRAAGRRST